jgi:hypothetical protein
VAYFVGGEIVGLAFAGLAAILVYQIYWHDPSASRLARAIDACVYFAAVALAVLYFNWIAGGDSRLNLEEFHMHMLFIWLFEAVALVWLYSRSIARDRKD